MALYCHGNGEDLGMIHDHLQTLSKNIEMSIIACEYPGYGLYEDKFPSEKAINDTVESIYKYMVNSMHIPNCNIVFIGRSIGTGPATQLSTKYNASCLVLISPFVSITAMAKELFSSNVSYFCRERFCTEKNIQSESLIIK